MSLVRLRAADVGRRVVVRHLLPDGLATDVVGELLHLRDDDLSVQPDDGPPVLLARTDVVAAKPVPPRTVRPTSSPEAVQRVADLGWPGVERARLGGWVLRVGNGFTGRANSALAIGDPGLPLPAAVDTVEAFFAERGLPPKVQVPFGLREPPDPTSGPDAEVARRGWTHDEPTLVMTADLRGRGPRVEPVQGTSVQVEPEPDEEWLSKYRYRGGSLPPRAREVLVAARWQRFVSVRRGGSTVAVGRVAVAEGWAGVTAMTVDEGHRRQGLGSLVLDELLRAGAAEGARFAYLQVIEASHAPIALYRRHGFTPHHRYHYRTRPPTGRPPPDRPPTARPPTGIWEPL